MRKLVLRKSVGSYSAGTVVEVVTMNHTNFETSSETVLVWIPGKDDDTVEVRKDNLVELRERSYVVPARNRRDRRKVDKKANEILRGMVGNA